MTKIFLAFSLLLVAAVVFMKHDPRPMVKPNSAVASPQ